MAGEAVDLSSGDEHNNIKIEVADASTLRPAKAVLRPAPRPERAMPRGSNRRHATTRLRALVSDLPVVFFTLPLMPIGVSPAGRRHWSHRNLTHIDAGSSLDLRSLDLICMPFAA